MQNEAEKPNFWKNKNFRPVEISGGPKSQGQNHSFLGLISAIFVDFEVLLTEISTLLPVEISTKKFCQISIFTGKKN